MENTDNTQRLSEKEVIEKLKKRNRKEVWIPVALAALLAFDLIYYLTQLLS